MSAYFTSVGGCGCELGKAHMRVVASTVPSGQVVRSSLPMKDRACSAVKMWLTCQLTSLQLKVVSVCSERSICA